MAGYDPKSKRRRPAAAADEEAPVDALLGAAPDDSAGVRVSGATVGFPSTPADAVVAAIPTSPDTPSSGEPLPEAHDADADAEVEVEQQPDADASQEVQDVVDDDAREVDRVIDLDAITGGRSGSEHHTDTDTDTDGDQAAASVAEAASVIEAELHRVAHEEKLRRTRVVAAVLAVLAFWAVVVLRRRRSR